jgi:phosphoheptose isomerase
MSNEFILNELCIKYPSLIPLKKTISDAADLIIKCYSDGGKVLACGNGGSSSDSDHIVGELMKSFESFRPLKQELVEKLKKLSPERGNYLADKLETGFAAISLSSQTSLITAICNDIDANLIFAQQIIAYGQSNDVLIAISTSGNSQNIIDACITAKALNIKIIGLTGSTGGRIKEYCDILINVPEKRTFMVQEIHLPVFHTLCLLVENNFFPNKK